LLDLEFSKKDRLPILEKRFGEVEIVEVTTEVQQTIDKEQAEINPKLLYKDVPFHLSWP